jgi:hypothetical protein
LKLALRERRGSGNHGDNTAVQLAWLYGYDVGRELPSPT